MCNYVGYFVRLCVWLVVQLAGWLDGWLVGGLCVKATVIPMHKTKLNKTTIA